MDFTPDTVILLVVAIVACVVVVVLASRGPGKVVSKAEVDGLVLRWTEIALAEGLECVSSTDAPRLRGSLEGFRVHVAAEVVRRRMPLGRASGAQRWAEVTLRVTARSSLPPDVFVTSRGLPHLLARSVTTGHRDLDRKVYVKAPPPAHDFVRSEAFRAALRGLATLAPRLVIDPRSVEVVLPGLPDDVVLLRTLRAAIEVARVIEASFPPPPRFTDADTPIPQLPERPRLTPLSRAVERLSSPLVERGQRGILFETLRMAPLDCRIQVLATEDVEGRLLVKGYVADATGRCELWVPDDKRGDVALPPGALVRCEGLLERWDATLNVAELVAHTPLRADKGFGDTPVPL